MSSPPTSAGSSARKLDKGSTVTDRQVVLTVVDPDRLQVRVDLAEKDLAKQDLAQSTDISASGKSALV